jgi:hypothetical protein
MAAIVDAMGRARRIDHPPDHDVVATDPNGAVPHQVHRIQGRGGPSTPCTGPCHYRRTEQRSPWHVNQAERSPLVQSMRNLGLGEFDGKAAVLYAGFDQIIDGAASLKGLPEPLPSRVEGQNVAIAGDHDQVIIEWQSDAIEVDMRQ